jgi:hypothetical protein
MAALGLAVGVAGVRDGAGVADVPDDGAVVAAGELVVALPQPAALSAMAIPSAVRAAS